MNDFEDFLKESSQETFVIGRVSFVSNRTTAAQMISFPKDAKPYSSLEAAKADVERMKRGAGDKPSERYAVFKLVMSF